MVEVLEPKRGKRGKIPRPATWQAGLELCLSGTRRGVDYPSDTRKVTSGKRVNVSEAVGTRSEAFAREEPEHAMECLTTMVSDLAREDDHEGAAHWQTLADALGEWLAEPFAERDPWEPESEFPTLWGIGEIAEKYSVGSSTVQMWRGRNPRFPKPVAELKMGCVWLASDFDGWEPRKNGRPKKAQSA